MTDESFFAAARAIPDPKQRAAYLDRACPDPAARREVEALLAAHDASSPLDRPPADLAVTGMYEPPVEQPGARVGPYKLLQQIGEGGMGTVFMAEQEEPVRRRVALKIVKPGMDSKQVVARFEAERQALSMMDHPNIARVLDAGTTASGRPFFVMELVHGVPITEFCDANKLTPRERLELFVPVCQAIQHAHMKGVIHRDVKPSNVLVTMYDDKPVPKVIDFGVAKAVEQRLTEKTLFTQFGTLVGTFEYMSPEQAEMNALGVDTRSDVYSLGVLLYELLTGTTPLERQRLRSAALGEVVRLIREEEPPKPSHRLSTSGTLAKVAAARKTEPGKLPGLVRGELDWIVMRCLEKDRTRRYETASGLAKDVQRYLSGDAVEACPPTVGYRMRKLIRRHRGSFVAAGLVAAAAVAALAGAGYGLLEARKQREVRGLWEQAEEARAQAEAAREQLAAEKRQTEEAREDLARVEYGRTVDLAHWQYQAAHWGGDASHLGRARELLASCRPDLRGWEWDYVHRLMNQGRFTLTHNFDATAAAFRRDGTLAATAHRDGAVRLWDPMTWRLVRSFPGDPDGRAEASAESVRFSPDGARLLTAHMDNTARIRDAVDGRELLRLPHSDVVYDAAFSPDGARVATCCQDRVARVWDAKTGALITEVKRYSKLYGPIAFHPDGKRVLTQDGDQALRLWDAATGREERTIELREYPRKAAFNRDGSRIVCGLADKTVRVYDTATGKPVTGFLHTRADIGAVAFSPAGDRVAAGADDGTVRLWDAATGDEVAVLRGHTAPVQAVTFSPDAAWLLTTGNDLVTRVWNAHDLPGQTIFRPKVGVFSLACAPDGSAVAVGGVEGEVQVWDLKTGKAAWAGRHGFEWVAGVAFSPDGRRLATGGRDERVRIRDAKTGAELAAWKGHTKAVECVAYHPDGSRLVSTSLDGTVREWDTASGTTVHVIDLSNPVWAAAFSPDGSLLATAGWDDRVRLWDTKSWALVRSLPAGAHLLRAVRFSGDGRRLASRASGGPVTVWDTRTWAVIRTLPCPREDGVSLALSPDGSRAVTAGKDGSIHVWDTRSGTELLSPAVKELSYNLNVHPATVYPVTFTPDGHRLVTACFDQSFRVWDATPEPGAKR